MYSTKAYPLRGDLKIEQLLEFFNGVEEVTEFEKLREFGGKLEVFDEEMLVKVIVVNGGKAQFQIKGDEKKIIERILNFFVFLYCQ